MASYVEALGHVQEKTKKLVDKFYDFLDCSGFMFDDKLSDIDAKRTLQYTKSASARRFFSKRLYIFPK
jgi:hypothetical protein